MIEYLNRETVMKELDRNSITKKITLSDGVSIYDTIQKLPTADVVEVVKCHECKYWKDFEYLCLLHSGKDGRVLMFPTDFCSCGERSSNE